MKKNRYFRVDVSIGGKNTPSFFYVTPDGLADLQYGWANYTSRMHDSLESAMDDFLDHLRITHGQDVRLSRPVAVTWHEVRKHNPSADHRPPAR